MKSAKTLWPTVSSKSIRAMLAGRLVLLLLLLIPAIRGAATAAGMPSFLNGVLNVVWGDLPASEVDWPLEEPLEILRVTLTEDSGAVHKLDLGAMGVDGMLVASGGLWALDRQRVEVEVAPRDEGLRIGEGEKLRPLSIRLALADTEKAAVAPSPRAAITGSQPWISILCKFSDVGSEPENLSYFQNMYGSTPGRLDHYWRESSYDAINILGSTAVNWVTLALPQTSYISTPGSGSNANLTALFNDCTAAANAAGVDFSNGGTGGYQGINMMFNGLLDCCAWGGSRWATLDGVTKIWRVTWEPPWGYADEGVIGHEMGHGFGLPHSNNWDGDSSPYDSPWDVMSSATGYAVSDATYGRLGKHTIAYHKDSLGWIPAGERFEVQSDGVYTIAIDHLAVASTANYRMARIPIPSSSRFYILEVRERQGGYDGALPGNAVLIFEVDPSRNQPAWLYDADVPPAGYSSNEGSMWKVGESFVDAANDISVSVDATTAEGFLVTLSVGAPPIPQSVPTAHAFGTVQLFESSNRILTLSNVTTGSAALEVSSMILTDSTHFSLNANGGGDPCFSTSPTIEAGDSCTLQVTFSPELEGALASTLMINANGEPTEIAVPLSGFGFDCVFGSDDVVMPDGDESGNPVEVEACESITAANYDVVEPGDVTFRALTVRIQDGFSVGTGARFVAENVP